MMQKSNNVENTVANDVDKEGCNERRVFDFKFDLAFPNFMCLFFFVLATTQEMGVGLLGGYG